MENLNTRVKWRRMSLPEYELINVLSWNNYGMGGKRLGVTKDIVRATETELTWVWLCLRSKCTALHFFCSISLPLQVLSRPPQIVLSNSPAHPSHPSKWPLLRTHTHLYWWSDIWQRLTSEFSLWADSMYFFTIWNQSLIFPFPKTLL